ncbi:serine hydrolase [Deinococcus ruber]|uniref:Beta-lactamase class A catalytic domain-containing protein n=1 Tax=Deinococcus ruber TaxID=1848197 RepID=A0A918FEE9_9DEIO|nr:serine hydrolase [Deinococcus ruber]GGR33480.1 hypothetical protein GCM10008957_49710 [Deinococcus ruber]
MPMPFPVRQQRSVFQHRTRLNYGALLCWFMVACASALAVPADTNRTCRTGSAPASVPNVQATRPLPTTVSGQVDFLAGYYRPDGTLLGTISLGNPDRLHPMASSFKPLVVHAVLADIDRGRLQLATPVAVSDATRSLGPFPAGPTPLSKLLDIAINGSNNTAADLLLLTYGPERLAREVHTNSPCTQVLLTTKGWWTAQSGLASSVIGSRTAAGVKAYGALPFEQRVKVAGRLIVAAQQVRASVLEPALDRVFASSSYDPASELDLQNVTTPRAYLPLVAGTLPGDDLSASSRALLRHILSTGCCRPAAPKLKNAQWWAKGGITWRVLNLTGVVERPDGSRLVYVYMNSLSNTHDAGALRASVPPVVDWIETQLQLLAQP